MRDHDRFYLEDDRKLTPKESFKFINKHIGKFLKNLENPKVVDIGCATGDFLYYLSTLYPKAQLLGLDVMPKLLKRAKKEVPSASFAFADIYSGKGMPLKKFDAVFLLAVHMVFDDHTIWINNLFKLTKVGGRIYVFGMFNPENVDVLCKVRYAGQDNRPWQAGWNIPSKKTIGSYLEKKRANYNFYDFSIPIDLPRHQDDPLRSWTFKMPGGAREIINGTQIIHRLALLEIIPK